MFRIRSKTVNLHQELSRALCAGRVNRALDIYELLEQRNPDEPRWSHRKGELLQRMGRNADAADSYERSVELYASKGFVARAAAMAKMILAIDPRRVDVLDRVSPEVARRLHREHRKVVVAAEQPSSEKSEAGPTETHGLFLTEVELLERPPPPEPLLSERPRACTLAQLPSMPLFAEVPPDVLDALVRESTLLEVSDQQRLVTAGTVADSLYVFVEGNAVAERGVDTQSLLLGEGDVAGISCLFSEVSYAEDVTACGRARVLRIGKPLLDRLVEQHPPFHNLLLEVLSRRLVATLFRTSPLFTAFDEGIRTRIARLFEVRRASAGTKLLEAGAVPDAMYLPLHGRIVARKPDGARIADVELGGVLGQESILTRVPSPITVEAATDALVLAMPVVAMNDLLVQLPNVVAHIRTQKSSSSPSGQRHRRVSQMVL